MLAPRQGDTDFVKILDFGLAKLAPEAIEEESEGPGQVITRHGSVFGTPRYMAPEQCVGSEVDERADLYALGLILYEALTGMHPFEEREPRRMIKHQLFTPVPPMKKRAPGVTIPASLEALVMRLVEKARGKRFASATELLAALAEVCEKEAILPPEPSSRFQTPRLGSPLPRPGGAPARAVQSDTMATQDVADSSATQDALSSVGQTQDVLPSVVDTQDLVSALHTQDLAPNDSTCPPQPPADKTQDLARHDSTQLPLPPADKTQDLPHNDATQPPLPPGAPPPASGRATAVVAADRIPTELPRSAAAPRVEESLASATGRAALLRKPGLLILLAAIVLGALLALYPRRPGSAPAPRQTPTPEPARTSSPRPAALPPASPAPLVPQDELARASATGVPALQQLQARYPSDPAVPRALAQLHIAQHNGLEALRWQKQALALDANSISDGDIAQAATLSLSIAETADPALALLEQDLGTRGLDALIALMNKPGRLKSRIAKRLARPEVRAHASPAALIALELSAAVKCEAKRALLTRAGRDGDQRTLQQLKLLLTTRGCGVLSLSDCWPCLRKDGALRNAISAITARAGGAH